VRRFAGGAGKHLMARKLKTYQTSLGFFDQAIAAPSMKAALEAWGADSNLFHQGAAKQSKDPDHGGARLQLIDFVRFLVGAQGIEPWTSPV
jgi:hypothetical protein